MRGIVPETPAPVVTPYVHWHDRLDVPFPHVGATVLHDQAQLDALEAKRADIAARCGLGISLSDVAVPFGQAAPEATQFFEAYSVTDGICTWEIY